MLQGSFKAVSRVFYEILKEEEVSKIKGVS